MEISKSERADLHTAHEEADVIIAQQVVHLADSGKMSIRVISDDTDVFVLLIHFYKLRQLDCNLVMIGTSPGRSSTSINIRATTNTHADIAENLLTAHALSGFDTVSYL